MMILESGKRAYGAHGMSLLCVAGFLLYAAGAGRAQDLRAGYAKVDVTPTGPVMMGGYDLRGTPSEGIHGADRLRSEEHTSELQSLAYLVCRLLLEKKKIATPTRPA